MTATFLLLSALIVGSQHPGEHHAGVDRRGDTVMGFSHEKTRHQFTLLPDGATIAVTARDGSDTVSVDAIRKHLGHITQMFAAGNFQAPMVIHDQEPPGVAVMRARKAEIRYRFDDVPAGGRVRITTSDRAAVDAVHAFLRFQIRDHRTGDPETIQAR